ncbi:MAG: zinc ribbon domain-containing protein [Candidatus Wallbacteria bacterium]|nr:zinc ribbon domain-containing protein [Candidatus Wallbacteria bacterium]
MPIYEYRCQMCDKLHEFFLRLNEAAPDKCPDCGGNLKKAVSTMAFVLKGSGFYLNDYASTDKKKGISSEKTPVPEAKNDVKAEAKTDSKTDAKTETWKDNRPEKTESGKDAKPEQKSEPKPETKPEPAKKPVNTPA